MHNILRDLANIRIWINPAIRIPDLNPRSLWLNCGVSRGLHCLSTVLFDVCLFQRMIDNTKVTCIQWVPGSPNHFIAAHASGQMYVYDERLPCGATPPTYQLFKYGPGFSVHTCRAKSTRNPLYRWLVDGSGPVYAIAFSPCTHYLATVSADGQLRVFNYDEMELIGSMKSYFGGLRCVAWSPDGRYVATGGEDDLVTVWSFAERRVVCRGSGHRSWVSGVAFDPYTCTLPDNDTRCANDIRVVDSGENQLPADNHVGAQLSSSPLLPDKTVMSYRLGSVGDDAHLCFWEITEDVLFPRTGSSKQRTSGVVNSGNAGAETTMPNGPETPATGPATARISLLTSSSESSGLSQKFASLSIAEQHRVKEPSGKRPFGTLASRTSDTRLIFTRSSKVGGSNGSASATGESVPPAPPLGSSGCPCLADIPLLEPLICKKVAAERLTAILFREDCFVMACQEGFVSTWARPSTLMRNGYM